MNVFPPLTQKLYPFDFYSMMRKNYPITYDEENDVYGIFRYYDVRKCLSNFKDFSSDFTKWFTDTGINSTTTKIQNASPIGQSLITSDPPKHRYLRNVISPAFNPKQISMLESKIEEIAYDLIDKVIENECMDLIHDLAYPLPITIIADLLGIPIEDHYKFKKWADQIISSAIIVNKPSKEVYEKIYKLRQEMNAYFSSIINIKNKDPKNDLISGLVKTSVLNINNENYIYGDRVKHQKKDGSFILSHEDIISFCTLLLLAGHVTTVNLIGNIFLSLFENINQFKLLKSNPSLYINSTIEETLRYRSPVQSLSRFVTDDIDIGNDKEKIKLKKGKRVVLWIGSANHDETIFPNAKQFDISRQSGNHIAFGSGIHLCIGAPLARLEARVILRVILTLLKDINLNKDKSKPLIPVNSTIIHGVENLPINFRIRNN